jgi:hypothetical protein
MLAIIDADSICCACGAAEELPHALSNTKNKMMQIIKKTDCSNYRAFLTKAKDKTAFRYKIYPEYKANRIGKKRPKYEQECREYLISTWNAEVVSEIEADDAVSICQWNEYNSEFDPDIRVELYGIKTPSILCGIDKDLDQIPGLHYNYNKDTFYYITKIQGLRALYLQMLTGDRADNVPRINKGWKQKEVEEAINKAFTEQELYSIIYNEIRNIEIDNELNYGNINDKIQWRGDLLYLWRKSNDKYEIPA